MKEYNYSRQLIDNFYTIGYGIKDEIEEISLSKKIVESIPNIDTLHIICENLDVKIIISPDLTIDEKNLLDIIVANHS
jgi:hypothetical protein